MEAEVRAIDLGYGRVKLAKGEDRDGAAILDVFPSIVARAQGNLGEGYARQRNTVKVEYKGLIYEVGQDAILSTETSSVRKADLRFVYSDDYRILMRASIMKMALSRIRVLVLGAPVMNYGEVKEYLGKQYRGVIDLGNGASSVHVDDVMVLPQPIGGFIHYGKTNGIYERMKNEVTLVIDPGYYTLDWVVTRGLKPVPGKSGSHPGGMHSVLRAIANVFANHGVTNPHDLFFYDKIDRAIYAGERFTLFGKDYDLLQHAEVAQRVIENGMNALTASVGDPGNIDNIVLVGGAAKAYLSSLRRHFDKHEMHLVDNPAFANVAGFYEAGVEAIS